MTERHLQTKSHKPAWREKGVARPGLVARLQMALKAGQRSSWLPHPPPQIHLALITRIDLPFALARLRVRGQLCEIQAQDLRLR